MSYELSGKIKTVTDLVVGDVISLTNFPSGASPITSIENSDEQITVKTKNGETGQFPKHRTFRTYVLVNQKH